MNSETIVLCYPAKDEDLERIQAASPGSELVCSDQDRIRNDIMKATIFCGHAKKHPIEWQDVVEAGNLGWIQSSAAGLDHCLDSAIVDSRVVVSGCSGLFANQVAEQTMALLLAMIRNMPEFFAAQASRVFERKPTDTLHGKTIGIVGFGGNGRRIAEVLASIAGQILATDLFPEFKVPSFVRLMPSENQDELFRKCDVVIVTLPLNSMTRKSIGERQFSLMKEGSYFVNVARGAVVDQKALLNAIEQGRIGFAGLDVVDPEPPLPSDRIWSYDRVLITPHVGAQSHDRISLTTELFCENLRRFREGRTLVNQVDKELQIPRPENRVQINPQGEMVWPEMA